MVTMGRVLYAKDCAGTFCASAHKPVRWTLFLFPPCPCGWLANCGLQTSAHLPKVKQWEATEPRSNAGQVVLLTPVLEGLPFNTVGSQKLAQFLVLFPEVAYPA